MVQASVRSCPFQKKCVPCMHTSNTIQHHFWLSTLHFFILLNKSSGYTKFIPWLAKILKYLKLLLKLRRWLASWLQIYDHATTMRWWCRDQISFFANKIVWLLILVFIKRKKAAFCLNIDHCPYCINTLPFFLSFWLKKNHGMAWWLFFGWWWQISNQPSLQEK